MGFDFTTVMRRDLPAPAKRWGGFPEYNFVGGHNDGDNVPVEDFIAASSAVLRREGRSLATYGLNSGPQGYRPLREFVAANLGQRTAMKCDADDVLITSGSLQALDLVNDLLVERGDTVIVEAATYGGTLTRLQRRGVNHVGVALDEDGMRSDDLNATLERLGKQGVRPKYIYTIPTVQNPTGSVMSETRRLEILGVAEAHGVPIFEDDCYAALLMEGDRPPAIRALDTGNRVIYCGSFSKTLTPALRVGYVVADWPVLSQMLALKTDAGSGAVEQMMLAEYCAGQFDSHVTTLVAALKEKRDAIVDALAESFGTAARYVVPKGGIFIWVTLPETVDTTRLAAVALESGIALNPGAEWSADAEDGRNRLRLCFANPTKEIIREGVAKLADICHQEFGVPVRSANIDRT